MNIEVSRISAEDNYPNGSGFRERQQENAAYQRRTGMTNAPDRPQILTRTYSMLNPQLWRDQNWETIEMMDETRKIWGRDAFDSSEFDYRFMRPKASTAIGNTTDGLGKSF